MKLSNIYGLFLRSNGKNRLRYNSRGSALVLTVIVLVNALLIVAAIASISIVERKASSKVRNSTPAFQAADSAVEWMLKKLKSADSASLVGDPHICSTFNSSPGLCVPPALSLSNGAEVEVYFVDTSGAIITDSSASIYDIRLLRAIGRFGNGDEKVSRALEVSVQSGFGCGIEQVDDLDGNPYDTVLIGSQCWMAQNLNVGIRVDSTNTGIAHSDMNDDGIIEKYCYDNDPDNCDTYGGLYDWDEAMGYVTTEGAQGICPDGWHIPTDGELYILENFLKDPSQTCAFRIGWDCLNAGERLKEGGDSQFEALLGGWRLPTGGFDKILTETYLMSSTEDSGTTVFRRYLELSEDRVYRSRPNKKTGFSIRCLKN